MSSSTRDQILRSLKIQGSSTVLELAGECDVSPVSIRHHLSVLQAEDLIRAEEVRHGVGRPRHVFSLTEKGHELFPSRYFRLTNRLLDEIKDSLDSQVVIGLFSGIAESMAQDYAEALQAVPLDQRIHRLIELLSEEGFEAEVLEQDQRLVIRELSCPYLQVGKEHPEVCMVDQRFISTALGVPVDRVTWLLEGDAHCSFSVDLSSEPNESLQYG
jgi:predicted ArsR family transcriptional regulator